MSIVVPEEDLDSLFAYKVRKLDDVFSCERLGVTESYMRYVFIDRMPYSVVNILYHILALPSAGGGDDTPTGRDGLYDILIETGRKLKEKCVLKRLRGRDKHRSSWERTFQSGGTFDESLKLNKYYTTLECCTISSKGHRNIDGSDGSAAADELMLFSGVVNMAVHLGLRNLDFISPDTNSRSQLLVSFELLKKYSKNVPIRVVKHINEVVVNPKLVQMRPRSDAVKNALKFVQVNWRNEHLLFSFVTMLCESGHSNIVSIVLIAMFGINVGNGSRCLCAEFIKIKKTIDKFDRLSPSATISSSSILDTSPFVLNSIVFRHYKPLEYYFAKEFLSCKSMFNAYEYGFDSISDLLDVIPSFIKRIIDEIISKWKYRTVSITTPGSKYAIKSYTGEDYPFSCFNPTAFSPGCAPGSYYPIKTVVHEKRKTLLNSIRHRSDFVFKGHHPCAVNQLKSSITMTDLKSAEVGDPNINVITIGNKSAYLVEEIASLFNNYNIAMVPQIVSDDDGFDSSTSSVTMLSVGTMAVLERVSKEEDFDDLLESICHVKNYRSQLCAHINGMALAVSESPADVRAHMHKIFKNILKLGMFIRGWKGGTDEPYPLKSSDTVIPEYSEEYYEMMVRITKSFAKIDRLVDAIPAEQHKTFMYRLPQFSHKVFSDYGVLFIPSFIVDQGNTLIERIELMKRGEDTENIFSCIRMGSNFVLASVYFYLTVFFNDPPPFDISEMSEIF